MQCVQDNLACHWISVCPESNCLCLVLQDQDEYLKVQNFVQRDAPSLEPGTSGHLDNRATLQKRLTREVYALLDDIFMAQLNGFQMIVADTL